LNLLMGAESVSGLAISYLLPAQINRQEVYFPEPKPSMARGFHHRFSILN